MYKRVKDLQELKHKSSDRCISCFIQLNFGLRSSKDIEYNNSTNTWYIYNYIDDSEQSLTDIELEEDTNIVKALNNNSLFYLKDYD